MSTVKINWNVIDNPQISLERFPSRRSVVYGRKGVVACSQPLACQAGLEILNKGGNASVYNTHNSLQMSRVY
jgi:gamma-glutamyltranspeptidase/glutathione hydrolase